MRGVGGEEAEVEVPPRSRPYMFAVLQLRINADPPPSPSAGFN